MQTGDVLVEFVPTDDQKADGLTKHLGTVKMQPKSIAVRIRKFERTVRIEAYTDLASHSSDF